MVFSIEFTIYWGRYGREKQYCDLIEKLFKEKGIAYEREKVLSRVGSDRNKADFIIENRIILEVKTMPLMGKEEYYQLLRYL
ncbi:MAG: hypothetical protein HY472_00465 [Candidatus Sungbacteria bacterium]|nr:hypothetical protein [Candidatus Sungbacteria bacterium]